MCTSTLISKRDTFFTSPFTFVHTKVAPHSGAKLNFYACALNILKSLFLGLNMPERWIIKTKTYTTFLFILQVSGKKTKLFLLG